MIAFLQDGDIWTMAIDGDEAHPPRPFLETDANESHVAFSPDGSWLAYVADYTGHSEIYVRPFPGPTPETRVSTAIGRSAGWSRDGRRLLYRDGAGMLQAVEFAVRDGAFVPEAPRALLDVSSYEWGAPTREWDVTLDGSFVLLWGVYPEPQPVTRIHVVLNWFDELKRLVPTDP